MPDRYASGTSLIKTTKERHLDSLENMIGTGSSNEIYDDLYLALKRLNLAQIKELHKWIAERITYEAERKTK